MYDYETPPTFRTNSILAAHDLNILRRNAIALDGLSQRIESAFDSTGAYGDPVSYNLHTAGDFWIWRGGLRWRNGHTTLTIRGTAADYGSAMITIYLDGVLKKTIAPSTNWSTTIDISSGYTDGQVIEIKIGTSGNSSKTSAWHVEDIYATPVAYGTAWPGTLPTFSGVYQASELQKLSQAMNHLYERIAATPFVPHLAHLWRNGTHKPQNYTLWNGSFQYRHAGDRIRIAGNATISTQSEELVAYITSPAGNRTVILFSGTAGNTYTFDALEVVPTGTSVGDYVRVHLFAACLTQPQPWPPNSLYNLLALEMVPQRTAVTPAALSSPNVLVSASDVNARLNAIVSALNTIKARVDASTSFSRTRAVRYKFANDEHQAMKFARTYAHVFRRRGERLIVTGKNVVLGWGAPTFEQNEDGATDYSKFKFANEQTLISGEAMQTQRVYLDSIAGLFPGTTYYLIGDVIYAGEFL